ncbi:protein spire homolog 1-like isoform X2 [Mytilus californianus]|uniref:protein spire homolog 1-like isoform X2 n=1 Tax=Mytilus californianus TaxID=6549 RepID=UPI002246F451|nr:protein spire homolog 1-like isoform X2 [Mytilus californianus]
MANTSQNENSEISIDSLSLEDILVAFNNAVNEEQAWSVCYQCAQFFQNFESQSLDDCRFKYHELYKYGKRALKFNKDGAVFIEYSEISRGTGKGPPGKLKRKNSVTGKDIQIVTENDAIQALGLVIYQALDYGLGDNEERHLGRDLEHLLELMINPDEEDETFNADDEGIEKDAKEGCTFQEITVLCVRHLTSQQDAGYHYKAVCRALAAEAAELLLFLDKVTRENKRFIETQLDQDLQKLDNLQRADWARLWVQMMRELRQGVRLKKVEHIHLPPVEFELTPFEILLEDIRTRRYTLNKVQVNGDIPNTVKSDAHAVMLDFIRSRPPLQPAKDRVLKSPPKRELSVREQLLLHIRSQPPKLKSISEGQHVVETSRTKLDNNNENENPQPVRKVIKPDFNLLLDSFEDDEDDDSGTLSPRSRRSSVATPSPEQEVPQWRRTVVRDVVTQERHNILKRRNTITVCESPQVSPTSPVENEASLKHREHESKIKRSGPVSKSNACPSDLRKRLNDKLHGCSSVSRLHTRRMHGSISEVPSESDNSESIIDEQKTVKSESQTMVRRASSSLSRMSSSTLNKVNSVDNSRVRRSSNRTMNTNDSDAATQNGRSLIRVQRKLSNSDENSSVQTNESKVRVRRKISDSGQDSVQVVKNVSVHRKLSSSSEISPLQAAEQNKRAQKLLDSDENSKQRTENIVAKKTQLPDSSEKNKIIQRATSYRIRQPVSHELSEDHDNNKSLENKSQRPHSPKIIIPKRSSSPISHSSPLSPTSPTKTHVSTCFAGLTEISSSPIKMHVSPSSKKEHENACMNDSEETEISLGRSLPSRRILVSRRSSMPVSKSCNDLDAESPQPENLHRTQSVLEIEPEKPRPKPRPRLSIKRNSLSPGDTQTDISPSVPKTESPAEITPKEESAVNPPKPVPRPRTKLVQRSQSQRTSVRHSLDLTQLRAINSPDNSILENGTDQEEIVNKPSSPRRSYRSETPDPSMLGGESSPRLSELNVNELLNKWQHPIECLSLTLEEVMHIRTVLTKAELESLINQPEFYSMVSKGKVCFTCKEVKFSILGQWGNRCKICKRNVCNTCLRKMNIPTEHFQNIPVHTLSPIPLGQEALDILKVYESTGSVPHSPLTQKKLLREIENKSPKKSLQRSQTFNSSPNLASPLPNKNLLKGPQMNVCCECKKMIMDIIRTSRTSIALINKRKTLQSTTTSNEEKRPSSLSASSLSLSVKNFFTQK